MPTIHAASQLLQQGALSPVDLVEECLAHIDRYESQVRAWVLVDREGALAEARRAHAELKRGASRGPLHGIPVGVKDIFDVHDWPTACGSRLWRQNIARHDCSAVRKLREAGAVLLGKTVTTQYASFDPPPTRNPWDHSRTPGGSSSGSAAAVACGMCPGALGSQTGGSITRPASYCGVAGLKPTYGRVSGQGVLPLAPSMDHPGPITGCVRDLALMLQALAGHDPADPSTAAVAVPNYLAWLDQDSPPPRLGRLREHFEAGAHPAVRDLMDRACAALTRAGAEVREVALPASFREVLARHRIVMAVEAAQYHEQRLRLHPDDYGPCITALLREGLACPAPEYARTREHQQRLRVEMMSSLDGVDALLMPATTSPAPDAATTGDPAFNSPWSYTGLPAVSFRAGWTEDGLPLAVQLVAGPWQEAPLLRAAQWCESVLSTEERQP